MAKKSGKLGFKPKGDMHSKKDGKKATGKRLC